jgi:hypothetical protein
VEAGTNDGEGSDSGGDEDDMQWQTEGNDDEEVVICHRQVDLELEEPPDENEEKEEVQDAQVCQRKDGV